MNILILEPEINGHFTSLYVRNVIKSFKKKKFNITILSTKKILKHETLKILKKENVPFTLEFMEELEYPEHKNLYSLIIFQIKNYLKIKKKFKEILTNKKIDHVFITNLEHFDKILGLFGSPFQDVNYSGILVNPKHHQTEYGFSKKNYRFLFLKYIFKFMVKDKKLKYIMINDYLFYEYVKKKLIKYKEKFLYFDEPAHLSKKINKITAKKNLNITQKSFVILVYGALRESKCILELVEIVKKIEKKKNIKIILAGKQNYEIKKLLNKKSIKEMILSKEIIVYDYFISSDLESELFYAADSVWVVYKNTPMGSSGVFYLSNLANIPIITNSEGLIGWYNKRYILGPIIDLNKYWQPSIQLENLLLKKEYYKNFIRNQKNFRLKRLKKNIFHEILSKKLR